MRRIVDALKRIERWSNWKGLSEKAFETILLLDIFSDVLDFDESTAITQCPTGKNARVKGKVDLVLKPVQKDPSSWVVIELKKPQVNLEVPETRKRALSQAGKYVVSYGASYGIVTNYRDWIFFIVNPKAANTRHIHVARILLWLKTGTKKGAKKKPAQLTILQKCLGRFKKGTIRAFFETLVRLNDIGEDRFNEILDSSTGNELPHAILGEIGKDVNAGEEQVINHLIKKLSSFYDSIGWKHASVTFKVKLIQQPGRIPTH
jgi:hypothetical protein